jgi:hypothetical protein
MSTNQLLPLGLNPQFVEEPVQYRQSISVALMSAVDHVSIDLEYGRPES